MLKVHIGIASMRQFQCVPTSYVFSINEFFTISFFKLSFIQTNEHVEMNKFACSLSCTWMTIIDWLFYASDSLSSAVSREFIAKLLVAWMSNKLLHYVYMLDLFCPCIQFYLLLAPFRCFVYFFISWFICSRRWCIDKLGVFYANQSCLCLDPNLN